MPYPFTVPLNNLHQFAQKHSQFPLSPPHSVPHSPAIMATTLGNPNRSCVSCKKRKVKCDRKVPACTSCAKSKLRCCYTSYSPPAFAEQSMPVTDEDEGLRMLRERIDQVEALGRERFDRLYKLLMEIKDSKSMQATKIEDIQSDLFCSSTVDFTRLLQDERDYDPAVLNSESNYIPYKRAIVTFNYNINGLRRLMGPIIAPILHAMTAGSPHQFPLAGFTDVSLLLFWIRHFFISSLDQKQDPSLGGILDPTNELVQVIPFDNEANELFLHQRYEIVFKRLYHPSPTLSSVSSISSASTYMPVGGPTVGNGDFATTEFNFEDDVFTRKMPWTKEGFSYFEAVGNGVFHDVVVEMRRDDDGISSLLDLNTLDVQQPLLSSADAEDNLVRGRLFF
ncbi:5313_t:CDS:2 [Paraglomus occultum]|uniref:5313_t:CDS:1 n=1 Tax=Paraglomus occultum TaxID=144539 RepID=A0A9N8YZB7_9GLOM|nr:5313_t:CDS:2 [Paraglomus occultum]